MAERNAQILVVDDCRMNSLLLRYILERAGYASDSASGGPEALRKAESNPYALIFLDIMLPGMDGIEVAGELLRRRPDPLPQIVFMTGIGEDLDADAVRESSPFEVLLKPIAPSAVLALVQKTITVLPAAITL